MLLFCQLQSIILTKQIQSSFDGIWIIILNLSLILFSKRVYDLIHITTAQFDLTWKLAFKPVDSTLMIPTLLSNENKTAN